MTVSELAQELQRLIANGHGLKDVGFPEGFHSSVFKAITIEENEEQLDGHPGLACIEVERIDK